jgi:hypothetical protein
VRRLAMRISFKGRNPFSFLFVRSSREDHLSRYVLREYRRGRSLREVLDDPYVRNRSTEQERARLLERPEVVAALGDQTAAELRHGLSERSPAPPATAERVGS